MPCNTELVPNIKILIPHYDESIKNEIVMVLREFCCNHWQSLCSTCQLCYICKESCITCFPKKQAAWCLWAWVNGFQKLPVTSGAKGTHCLRSFSVVLNRVNLWGGGKEIRQITSAFRQRLTGIPSVQPPHLPQMNRQKHKSFDFFPK